MEFELLESEDQSVSEGLTELVKFLDVHVMTTEAVRNRNFFPVGIGVDAKGERFIPGVREEADISNREEKLAFAFQVLRSWAAQGKIIFSAVAMLARTQPDERGDKSDCVLIILDDVTNRRFYYLRTFRVEDDRCVFGDPVLQYQGPSPIFTSHQNNAI
jgi:hypothetical protein